MIATGGNLWKTVLILAYSLGAIDEIAEAKEYTHPNTIKDQPIHSNNHRELIINGRQAKRGRFPYFSTLDHDCGGALVAPDVILTAGHCLPKHKDSIQPLVGTYSFYDEGVAQVFDIVAMERHPHWKALGEDEFRHDVTLLFLNDTADNTPYLKLNRNASLPFAGEQVTAMGVGWTSADWKHAKKAMILQQVELNYLENDQCEQSSNKEHVEEGEDVIRYKGRIHPDHMCTTGGPHNKKDACAFDSGSPIILEGDGPEDDILFGLVSWGEGCADPDFPAVNTRITDSLDFIERSVCEHSAHPPPEFNCFGKDNNSTTSEPTSTRTPTETPSLAEETLSPTEAPLSPTQQHTTILSPWFLVVAGLVLAIGYWMRQRAKTRKTQGGDWSSWMPSYKDYYNDDRYASSETEYLYHNSPASSRASSTGSGSSYDAIEIQDV